MEFNEKLQELRKNRGLTQEELAEALYVSRTAISKWESGRGYPGIDSLKEISKFFSVTIDDLLSGEKVIYIAEKENESRIDNICDLLFGTVDLMSIMLIILPLYPEQADNFIFSVPLFAYTASSPAFTAIYWTLFVSMIAIGIIKLTINHIKIKKGRNILTNISVALSIVAVLILAVTRQTYAIITAFILLIIKGVLIIRKAGA